MNTRKASYLVGAALLALCITSGSALATILVGPAVTGHITSISGVDAVSIDGHLYYVKAGSAAAATLPSLSPGQIVDVYLDGPTTTSASQVIGIAVHSDQTGQ